MTVNEIPQRLQQGGPQPAANSLLSFYCDTHAHLHGSEYGADRDAVLESAAKAGLAFIVDVGIDAETSQQSMELAARQPMVFATVGVHPHEAGKLSDGELRELLALHRSAKVVAIGEMGLDYFYDHSPRPRQREVYAAQIEFALAHDRPVVVHARDAVEEAIDIMARDFGRFPRGVFHCFAGDYRQAARLLDEGMLVSFGGPVTFKKNDALRELIARLPLSRILLETDCPYLAPVPHRGKRNVPENVTIVAAEVARLHGTTAEHVARVTTATAAALFGIALVAEETGR